MNYINKIILLVLFYLQVFIASAQQKELINVDNITDCSRAMTIVPLDTFGFTTPPPGMGKVMEFKKNPEKSLFYFENEHHTSWYRMKMPYTGVLCFDIIPMRIEDDYDFILYRYTDTNFCSDVKAKKILPVRTAISRNDKKIASRTGLDIASDQKFIHSGPGASYSQGVSIKKGEVYYLVLDNCYANGLGHKIVFRPMKEFTISGKIVSQQMKSPVKAEVNLINLSTYDTLTKTKSDSVTGSYILHGFYKDSLAGNYELVVSAPGYFYYDTAVNAIDIQKSLSDFDLPIPKLEKGKKIRINNINFYGNTTVPYPETKYIFIKMLQVLIANPKLVIQIEGHVNGCNGGLQYSQNLSDARAKAVKNYLTHNGINPNRIYTIGYSCRYMLYPEPKNEQEGKLNRRVEIKVISF